MAQTEFRKQSAAKKPAKRKGVIAATKGLEAKSLAGKQLSEQSMHGFRMEPLRAYSLKGDAFELIGKMKKLPRGATLVILTENQEAEAKVKSAAAGALGRTRFFLRERATVGKSHQTSTKVDRDAFEPDARARALLRGRQYARDDLREAGGAYGIQEVRELLHGVSRQAIDKRVNEGSLLAVPGPSNRRRYPTVQFMDDGEVVDGLKDVQAALGFSSPWSVLNFLINPQDGLEGDKPITRLRNGDLASVIETAHRIGVQGA